MEYSYTTATWPVIGPQVPKLRQETTVSGLHSPDDSPPHTGPHAPSLAEPAIGSRHCYGDVRQRLGLSTDLYNRQVENFPGFSHLRVVPIL